jgi:hypothetical protein
VSEVTDRVDDYIGLSLDAINQLQAELRAANARVAELEADLQRLRNPKPSDEEFWDCVGEEWT